jgi:RNA polymerase sigma-70 factor (ECF subfamily)
MRVTGQRTSNDAQEMLASIGDPERFTAIVERHFAEIFGYLARRVGAEAEDLASETFVVAFRRRSTYDATRPDARPWLYGIATNLLRRQRRSELRQLAAYGRAASETSIDHWADDAEQADSRIDARAAVTQMAWAFSQLDDEHRDALYLVSIAGLSYHDAAQSLGLKVGTVHSRVARGRSMIRELCERRQVGVPSHSTITDKE